MTLRLSPGRECKVPREFPVKAMVTVRYFRPGYALQVRIAELAGR